MRYLDDFSERTCSKCLYEEMYLGGSDCALRAFLMCRRRGGEYFASRDAPLFARAAEEMRERVSDDAWAECGGAVCD